MTLSEQVLFAVLGERSQFPHSSHFLLYPLWRAGISKHFCKGPREVKSVSFSGICNYSAVCDDVKAQVLTIQKFVEVMCPNKSFTNIGARTVLAPGL